MNIKEWRLYAIYALGRIIKGSQEADKKYLGILFKYLMGKKCDFDNPKTYNEKLQWLKIYDRNPLYTQLVDKYEVRRFISERIGDEYLIHCLDVWNHFDEIDFDKLPNQFVLKCTHDSGGLIICKDKSKLDMVVAKKKINHCLKRNYFPNQREWPYKDVRPRIIAEEYLGAFSSEEIIEYKIFCFDGEPKLFLVCKGEGHGSGRTNDFYDLDWQHIPVTMTYPNAEDSCPKPKEYDELLQLASRLSVGIPQVRVDFYVADGKIYFGELTFFHDSGFCKFKPEMYDQEFGKLIHLPKQ